MDTKNKQKLLSKIEEKLSKIEDKKELENIKDCEENCEENCILLYKLKRWNKAFVSLFFVGVIVSIVAIIFGLMTLEENIRLRENLSRNILPNVTLEIFDNSTTTKSVTVPNNVVGGMYNQSLTLDCKNLSKPQVVRVKVFLTRSDGETVEVSLAQNNMWQVGGDGYVYYYAVVEGSKPVTVFDSVKFGTDNLISTMDGFHYLSFVVECLDFDSEIAPKLWEQAPTSWINGYVDM